MHILLLIISILIAVIAQLFFKAFSLAPKSVDENLFYQLFDYKLITGFSLYFISAVLYIISLKKIDLSVAYPSISLSYIFVIVLSHVIFNEPLTAYKIAGSILIALGVSLMWK